MHSLNKNSTPMRCSDSKSNKFRLLSLPHMHVTTSGSQSKAHISLQKLCCKLCTNELSCCMEQHCRLQVDQDLANYTFTKALSIYPRSKLYVYTQGQGKIHNYQAYSTEQYDYTVRSY
ncbi:hypothetical protein J6590_065177 [Homalodisca vitripennis]|nr:hypothetical protein J6590_065177 [Homalodisca vitripennis]